VSVILPLAASEQLPNGGYASGSYDNSIRIWPCSPDSRDVVTDAPPLMTLLGHEKQVWLFGW
jgi:WD40 repeat protein